MFAVAVLDGVDDRLADGDADPVDRVLVEGGQLTHAIAQDLHEIQHVEEAGDLQPDEAAAGHHAVIGFRARTVQDTRVNNILPRLASRLAGCGPSDNCWPPTTRALTDRGIRGISGQNHGPSLGWLQITRPHCPVSHLRARGPLPTDSA